MMNTPNLSSLLEIFNIKSKRELVRYSRTVVIHQRDLVGVIIAAQQGGMVPYRYANHFASTVADNLHPNAEERDAIASNGIGGFKTRAAHKFTSKMFQLIHERRMLSAHLFYTLDHKYWHLFYSDNRDT